MSKKYAQPIKEGIAFWCKIPDIRVDTEDSSYYRKSPHYIKVIRIPYGIQKSLEKPFKSIYFRIYKSEIEALDGAELFVAQIDRYDIIYQIPTEWCHRKKIYFDNENKAFYFFFADEIPCFAINNTEIGNTLKEIINEEKGKK
ncbi:MAG: hypothetical protein IJ345_04030 [Clostridia bacterium]|nr:hypothetical protein [Clostridia bacterium]